MQTDGQIKTGRDVVVAALLGADEVGFATSALIATGCVMMRACHLNTCPVGIATQDPELRKRFTGQPEHVVNFLFYVAEEARQIMARLGVRRYEDLVGRVDLLEADDAIEQWKERGIDLSALLARPDAPEGTPCARVRAQDSPLTDALDWQLIEAAAPALERGERVEMSFPIRNVNRTVGGLLSHHVTVAHGRLGLPDGTIHVSLTGRRGSRSARGSRPASSSRSSATRTTTSARASPAARSASVRPTTPASRPRRASSSATRCSTARRPGSAYFRGLAGERFAVRNSGASAVVEGVGDHGCEYMTGGIVVVLGRTGRNFAAGMSGGIAYVLDDDGTFATRCNRELVGFDPLEKSDVADDRDARHRAPRAHRARRSQPGPRQHPCDRDPVRQGDATRLQARARRPRDRARRPSRLDGRRRLLHGRDRGGGALMGQLGAFLKIPRAEPLERDPKERVHDVREFVRPLPLLELRNQGARCMECGVPFCHHGCPLGNLIPDWNDLVYRDRWREAIDQLHRTNNFPEFTGRLCPAPCEAACVLEIREGDAVTIKQIELSIVDRAWEEGWIVPRPRRHAHRPARWP